MVKPYLKRKLNKVNKNQYPKKRTRQIRINTSKNKSKVIKCIFQFNLGAVVTQVSRKSISERRKKSSMANGGMTNGVGGPGGNGNGEFFDEDDEDEYRSVR